MRRLIQRAFFFSLFFSDPFYNSPTQQQAGLSAVLEVRFLGSSVVKDRQGLCVSEFGRDWCVRLYFYPYQSLV